MSRKPRGIKSQAAIAPATSPSAAWVSPGICLFLIAAVWMVFGQTRDFNFVNYDDDRCVYENATVRQGLRDGSIAWVFTHTVNDNWLPVTTLAHMLDCRLYGLKPRGPHLTNVALHAANAVLLFLLLRGMTGAIWRSAFVGGVFAVHPLHAESVAWISERKDVLSALFFILTIWAYARYAGESKARSPKSIIYYVASLFLYALGLMSKPMLVTLPFVLLLLDYWPLKRSAECGVRSAEAKLSAKGPTADGVIQSRERRALHPLSKGEGRDEGKGNDPSLSMSPFPKLLLEKIPFFILAAADCVATVLAQKSATVSVAHLGLFPRLANALTTYTTYILEMFYPARLAPFYYLPPGPRPIWIFVASLIVLIVISTGVMMARRNHPWLLVGWLWYLGMLVPVIGLMQVGEQSHADRYTYLPQIGLYVMLAWGVFHLRRQFHWPQGAVELGMAAIVIGLVAVARTQTAIWKDSIALWKHSLAVAPENPYAFNNLGLALAAEGNFPEAIQDYESAIKLKPDYADAHNDLGLALAAQGNIPEAVQHYQTSIQLQPDNAAAIYNLANIFAQQKKLADAVQLYDRAIQLWPEFPQALYNSGNALADLGKLPEAVERYERALQLDPDNAGIHNNLGNALIRQGKLPEAIQHFERARQLKPDFIEAISNLATALALQNKLHEAIDLYQQALDIANARQDAGAMQNIQRRLNACRAVLLESERPQPIPAR